MRRDSKSSSGPAVTYESGRAHGAHKADMRMVHFNDVYHVDASSSEPVGGLARFITLLRDYQEGQLAEGQNKVLTLFSGDAFNPSLESTVTRGQHMVPVLNATRVDCACVGNHDFDFGMKQFRQLTEKCNFPWLLANVLDPNLGDNVPLGNCKATYMITAESGLKVGLIGLGEREWLETINSLPPGLIYKSASATAKELVPKLREQGADMVVCLSHMREPNDKKLADQTDGLMDIILGGHDHTYSHSFIKGTHVLRSGTDFKQLSYIEARRKTNDQQGWDFDIWRRDITSEIKEDPETLVLVSKLTSKLQRSLSRVIGWTATPLDGRFRTVRMGESNLGNFVCDILRHHHEADCAIMAAGTIRGDQVYPPGAIRIKDVTTCFPFEDPAVLLRVTGQAIWDALENGVSLYPALEGRFPQVSNIVFEFDPKRGRGGRLIYLNIGGKPYQRSKKYLLATRGYMGRGKDGYDSLLVKSEGGEAEEIVDEENGIIISTILRQYFMGLRTIGQWKHLAEHWDRLAEKAYTPVVQDDLRQSYSDHIPKKESAEARHSAWAEFLHERLGLDHKPVHEDHDEDYEALNGEEMQHEKVDSLQAQADMDLLLMRKFWARWVAKAGVKSQVCDPIKRGEFAVEWTRVIAPVEEGRVRMVIT